MELQVTTSHSEGVAVVTAVGEVDLHTAPQLEAALAEQIAAGHPRLVVDLSGVGFLDSTGLGVLVKALKAAREGEGWIRLVVTSPRIARVFEITGLDAQLPRFDTTQAALAG